MNLREIFLIKIFFNNVSSQSRGSFRDARVDPLERIRKKYILKKIYRPIVNYVVQLLNQLLNQSSTAWIKNVHNIYKIHNCLRRTD